MIEMNHRQNDTKLLPKLMQNSEQGYGVRSSRYSNADAVPRWQQFGSTNMFERSLGQPVHANIVQLARLTIVSRAGIHSDCGSDRPAGIHFSAPGTSGVDGARSGRLSA